MADQAFFDPRFTEVPSGGIQAWPRTLTEWLDLDWQPEEICRSDLEKLH
jgi:hypothetical protein